MIQLWSSILEVSTGKKGGYDIKKSGKKASYSFNDKVLNPLRAWTRTGADIEISYRTTPDGHSKKIAVDYSKLEKAVPKPAKVIEKKWISGKVERLSKDEQLYGIKTADGALLHCPMDKTKENLYLECYSKGVVVDVLASYPPRPQSGQWKAKIIHEIFQRKQPLPLIKDLETNTEFDIESIPGIIKPKYQQLLGFSLDNLLPGLTSEDADSLSDFLNEYRGQ